MTRATVHTFTAAVRYAAIPDKLDTELRYTASHGVDNMNFLSAALAADRRPIPG